MPPSQPPTHLESAAIDALSAGGRILVSRLDYLGDVILSLPMVATLRERFPKAEIDYMTRGDGADVLHGEPTFSEVIRVPHKSEGNLAMWRLIRRLRQRRYAAAVDLYSNPRSALLTWLSGAKLRIGGDRRLRRHLYTHATAVPESIRAATDHHMHFLEPLRVTGKRSRPALTISNTEAEQARNVLDNLGVGTDAPVVGIHPGGKWEVKRWPVAKFAELSARLIDRHGLQVVVFCGPGEERYRDALRESLGERGFYLPTLTIRETAGVIGALDGMVVCDGGIMHVSVAVNTPTVGIFGSSEPDIWFPYEELGPFVPAYVPIECRPCHSHVCSHISCLQNLTGETVERKLLDVIDRPGTASHSTRSL